MVRMSGADRRQQIVDTAIEVILRRGIAQAATRDVTKALGVGSGLLHHYFPSWAELRAEAVRQAAQSEMAEVDAMIADLPASTAIRCLADWMVEDDDMRHWRLWLNAQDEAHRDTLLAEVMVTALRNWHRMIANLLRRACEEGSAHIPDADAAAWRLIALMDGLASTMLVKDAPITPQVARDLILSQIKLEGG